MIRGGIMCRRCKGGSCVELPTPDEPVQVACVSCNEYGMIGGKPCADCNGRGYNDISDCPKKLLDSGLMEVLDLFDMMETGVTPITGGMLDQSAWFVNAYREFRRDCNWAECEAMR